MRALFLLVSLCLIGYSCSDFIGQPVYNSINYHWYQLIIPDSPLTWAQANSTSSNYYLVDKLGYLVTVNDALESQWLRNTFFAKSYDASKPHRTIWTGGKKTLSTGLWAWFALGRISVYFYNSSKSAINPGQYNNWVTGEPIASTTSNCLAAHFSTSSSNDGFWVAKDCETALASFVLLEYDPPSPSRCGTGFLYTANPYPRCVDVDECLTAGKCGSGYTCQNTNGSYICNDINECSTPGKCGSGYECQNTEGSFQCVDVNECSNPNQCPSERACKNTDGSFECVAIELVWFKIQSRVGENLVLDLENGATAPLTPVIVAESVESDTQLWRFTPEGYIINKASLFALDIKDEKIEAGTPIIIWPRKPIEQSHNQLWKYNEDTGSFTSDTNVEYTLDVFEGKATPGQKMILWWTKTAEQDNSNQLYDVVYVD